MFRLSVQLYGFELHIYNRSHLYSGLEKAFGLEPGIFPEEDDPGDNAQVTARTITTELSYAAFSLLFHENVLCGMQRMTEEKNI